MARSQTHTVEDLYNTIDHYMYNNIDGDNFDNEQDFEDEIHDLLLDYGFNVRPKQNVSNVINHLYEQRVFGAPEEQIPDIPVLCDDGLVFLELKRNRNILDYVDDIAKIDNFLDSRLCAFAGVLFIDETSRENYEGWKLCQANQRYNYYFNIKY